MILIRERETTCAGGLEMLKLLLQIKPFESTIIVSCASLEMEEVVSIEKKI